MFQSKKKTIFTIISFLLLAIFCISITPVTFQNDIFYTIKIGEHIFNNGIDMLDAFSWHIGLTYTYPHWLYDLITYIIYKHFGFTGIYICTCLLAILLGYVIYYTNTKLFNNQVISFVIAVITMYFLRGFITARAQLVTFILFALTIYFIEMFLKTLKKRYAIGLIIIPIMIANLHVAVFTFYFILFLPYIVDYIIGLCVEHQLFKKLRIKLLNLIISKSKDKKKEKLNAKLITIKKKGKIKLEKVILNTNTNTTWLLVLVTICFFTGCLTPLGDVPYTYLTYTIMGNSTSYISEHLPIVLRYHMLVVGLILVFIILLMHPKVKVRLCDLFMLGGLGLLLIFSQRQVSMFVLITAFILNRLIIQVFKKETMGVKGIILIIIVMLTISYYQGRGKFDDSYVGKSYPVEACDYILENIDLHEARIFNSYSYGSYLLFRGIPVFIDSRADLYLEEFNPGVTIFDDFMEVFDLKTDYKELFTKYAITHALIPKDSDLYKFMVASQDPNLALLYEDDNFILYEVIGED